MDRVECVALARSSIERVVHFPPRMERDGRDTVIARVTLQRDVVRFVVEVRGPVSRVEEPPFALIVVDRLDLLARKEVHCVDKRVTRHHLSGAGTPRLPSPPVTNPASPVGKLDCYKLEVVIRAGIGIVAGAAAGVVERDMTSRY